MPRIFDNIDEPLLSALKMSLCEAYRADFCVGYFNLRGWAEVVPHIDGWAGNEGNCVRLIVGMQGRPDEELRKHLSLSKDGADGMDNPQALRLKLKCAEEFRRQLMLGAPTDADERGLRNLSRQLKERKVIVKLFLRYSLHAKLYLTYHQEERHPIDAYLGSSNLTFAGLSMQGELNTEVGDYDACAKLEKWFQARWDDRWCLDITDELVKVIDESWARAEALRPYDVYLKMAYHLAQDARAGLSEFQLPRDFADRLFDFQAAAVRIAAHHLNKRGGVLLGDVVGLGKTFMATALARIFQDDQSLETLIICPKNLVPMWKQYVTEYRLLHEIMPLSMVMRDLPKLRRYRLIIIDESHNLRNREGKRYKVIQDYIAANESKCILLSATPYNKAFVDLSAQLGLFIDEQYDLGIRPEQYLRELGGEAMFTAKHQVPVRSLRAFEHSEFTDDWRELMRLYMVRRTRTFILDNYTETDPDNGRRFLRMKGGERAYFPSRIPRTVSFGGNGQEQYQQLYADDVVNLINSLELPRYGLGQYISPEAKKAATPPEKALLENLSRAGQRLMGFCRTNLFKRLESSGSSFLQSIDRHVLRNYVHLYAIENGLDLPVGVLDAGMLDPASEDEDIDSLAVQLDEDESNGVEGSLDEGNQDPTRAAYIQRAKRTYAQFRQQYGQRFKWLRPSLFTPRLKKALADDAEALISVLNVSGAWQAEQDSKLAALINLLRKHGQEKVLVFSQFADTIRYLDEQIRAQGIRHMAMVTGNAEDPTQLVYRFSPRSHNAQIAPEDELRVLLATDVLSEGQNLQDCHIVINYDLPWAIIRLVQRAGRVDRIGQQAEKITCYSFLPADGVEQIIRLRARVRQRLQENVEVVGSDEQFFEDEASPQQLRDLYTEKSGILDGEQDTEVDLASYAYQIWLNATKENPALEKKIAGLPDVVYSTRHYRGSAQYPEGVLVYMKTADGTDSLAWVDEQGNSVTQSQLAILRAAACEPDTPTQSRHPRHHELVRHGIDLITEEARAPGGQLGKPSGARFKTYQRLKAHVEYLERTAPMFLSDDLKRAVQDIYDYPLRASATATINRQLRAGISDEDLAKLAIWLRSDDRLSLIQQSDDEERQEPRILCSLGLFDQPS